MGISYNPHIVSDGLVLCLDAANPRSYSGAGSTWSDLSGNGNNGTFGPGTAAPAFGGDNGGYLDFDGSDDYGDVGSITPNIGDFTVGFIYQLTGAGGRGGLFERRSLSPGNGFSLGQGGAGNWAMTVSGTSNFNNSVSVNFTYPSLNTWYYDVAVYSSGNTLTNYRNGTFVSSSTGVSQGNLSTQGTRTNFLIANRDNNTSLPCKVALVNCYNRALTPQEIRQNFNATRGRYGI